MVCLVAAWWVGFACFACFVFVVLCERVVYVVVDCFLCFVPGCFLFVVIK